MALADYLASYVDKVYGAPSQFAAPALFLATFAFAWQIYFDFSGYTDMARGIAKIMGFDLMLNFNNPYLATGLAVGFFAGLLGIGGGAAMVPLLAFIFAAKGFAPQYTVHLALGTCIAAIMFTAVSSARSHHRHKAVNWEILRRLFPGVIVGALAGAVLARFLSEWLLAMMFTALVYYAATLMLIAGGAEGCRQRRDVGHRQHRRPLLRADRDRLRGDGGRLSRAPRRLGA